MRFKVAISQVWKATSRVEISDIRVGVRRVIIQDDVTTFWIKVFRKLGCLETLWISSNEHIQWINRFQIFITLNIWIVAFV